MTLNPYDPRLKAFQSQIFPNGVDLRRSVVGKDLGIYVATVASVFRAGQVLARDSSGNMVVCDGTGGGLPAIPYGVAKWNKATSQIATIVDEAIVLNGTTATSLKHGSLFGAAPGVAVRSAPNQGGTTYTETTDFTVSYTNGTVTRVALGAIADGATVYVTYSYFLTENDLDFQGRNFWNFNDDVTIQQNRITVITDWSILFTTMYTPSRTWVMSDTLYVDGGTNAGLWTNQSGGGRPEFGKVFQVPTADDPYLGVVTPGHTVLSP